jgi:hypothetical protein
MGDNTAQHPSKMFNLNFSDFVLPTWEPLSPINEIPAGYDFSNPRSDLMEVVKDTLKIYLQTQEKIFAYFQELHAAVLITGDFCDSREMDRAVGYIFEVRYIDKKPFLSYIKLRADGWEHKFYFLDIFTIQLYGNN